MLKKHQKIRYKAYSYEIVMPQSSEVQTITVNRLTEANDNQETPLLKIILPVETGYFKGVKYTEQNTLLGYQNQKWRKLKSIQFDETGEQTLGIDQINTVDRLSDNDKLIRQSIIESFAA